MKLFGEFLIEKNVINATNLTSALVEQVKSTPPVCEVVHRLNLLNSDQMLAIFRYQQEHRIDFLLASKNFDFWTTDIEQKVQKEIDQARIPLGQILVRKGITDLITLTKMLDEFLSTVEAPSLKPTPSDAPAANSSSPGQIDPLLLAELESGFSEGKFEELMNILHLVEQNVEVNELVEEFLSDYSKNLHSLKGMCKFLKISSLESLFTNIEQITNKILDKTITEPAARARKVSKILSAFQVSWDIRNTVLNQKNESSIVEQVTQTISSLIE